MKCKKCNKEAQDGAKYCSYCGCKLEVSIDNRLDTIEENIKKLAWALDEVMKRKDKVVIANTKEILPETPVRKYKKHEKNYFWSKTEDEELLRLERKYKLKKKLKKGRLNTIARKLKRGKAAIKTRLSYLHKFQPVKQAIIPDKKVKRWTKSKDDLVKQLYGTVSTDYIARKLGKTTKAIYIRAFKLKVKKYMLRKRPEKFKGYDQRCIELANKQSSEVKVPAFKYVPANMTPVLLDVVKNAASPGMSIGRVDAGALNVDDLNYTDFMLELWEKMPTLCSYLGIKNKFKILKEGRNTWLRYG